MNNEGMQGIFAIAVTSLAAVAVGALFVDILDEVAKECETLDVAAVTPCDMDENSGNLCHRGNHLLLQSWSDIY